MEGCHALAGAGWVGMYWRMGCLLLPMKALEVLIARSRPDESTGLGAAYPWPAGGIFPRALHIADPARNAVVGPASINRHGFCERGKAARRR